MYILQKVNLLWQRAICDPEFRRIFCLVHAEKLSYQTADKALQSLTDIMQGQQGNASIHDIPMHISLVSAYTYLHTDYRLVVICSSYEEDKSPIISKLHQYRRPYGVSTDISKYRVYLKSHFVDGGQPLYQQLQSAGRVSHIPASVVDHEGCVHFNLYRHLHCRLQ